VGLFYYVPKPRRGYVELSFWCGCVLMGLCQQCFGSNQSTVLCLEQLWLELNNDEFAAEVKHTFRPWSHVYVKAAKCPIFDYQTGQAQWIRQMGHLTQRWQHDINQYTKHNKKTWEKVSKIKLMQATGLQIRFQSVAWITLCLMSNTLDNIHHNPVS